MLSAFGGALYTDHAVFNRYPHLRAELYLQSTLRSLHCDSAAIKIYFYPFRYGDGIVSDPRHMPLPDETDDFAADAHLSGVTRSHDPARRRHNGRTQSTEDLGSLVLLGIDAATWLTDLPYLRYDPSLILSVLQIEPQLIKALALHDGVVRNIPLILKNPGHLSPET